MIYSTVSVRQMYNANDYYEYLLASSCTKYVYIKDNNYHVCIVTCPNCKVIQIHVLWPLTLNTQGR